MSVQAVSETVQLKATNRKDVERFIKAHADIKDSLVVEVDCRSVGDYWASMLRDAGFQVLAIHPRAGSSGRPSV